MFAALQNQAFETENHFRKLSKHCAHDGISAKLNLVVLVPEN